MIVILDSGVLHTLVSTSKVKEVTDCQDWFYYLLSRSARVVTSSLCNYEVKRELIRRKKVKEINNLNQLKALIDLIPVDDPTLELAAELWAFARNKGIPTADDISLDADVIICAQYQLLAEEYPGRYVVIATTNVKHLSRFTEAKEWQDIEF
ncbi:MAG: type II toxin-antitoxin system VapC family toxin [Xenococcaceae cyanobacterium MO_188.B19]|nr:type II toxin-antitoxin system VapC family toxin [Xenococcaceae cyanobacterium MO_188.B19]